MAGGLSASAPAPGRPLCFACKLRPISGPCSECLEGVCVDVACAGLYQLKSLGETQKRVICKRCIEKLKQKANANRTAASGSASATVPSNMPSDGADNPMFLAAAARRRNRNRDDSDNEDAPKKEGQPEDQDDPFADCRWEDEN